ncbi:MAG: hypothetical protein U1F20_01215 [Lysobacterales bacterium]
MHDLNSFIHSRPRCRTISRTTDRRLRIRDRASDPQRRGVRTGLEGSAWTELDIGKLADEAFHGFFLAQVSDYLIATTPGSGSVSRFRFARGSIGSP